MIAYGQLTPLFGAVFILALLAYLAFTVWRGLKTPQAAGDAPDDAAQDITHVVRGEDLADATQIHLLLQSLMDLPTPVYHHHRLIRDEAGKRLAKRDDARAIATYRDDGKTPEDIRALVGL